jgi:surface protein
LCKECIKLNKCKNSQRHSYVDFKIKNKEISYKENFISDFFVKKDEYKQKTNKDTFGESEKKSEQIISEKSEYLEMGGGQGIKVIQEKNLSEYLEEAVSLKSIFDIIEKSKDKMPSYRHYENIINIYYFLCDKLNLKYYSFSNNQKKIRLFGEIFIKNNINKCSVMINNELKKIEDCEFYELEDVDKDLNITLLKEGDITDMSYMFNECEVLQFISKGSGSEWSTNNVVDMSYMFCRCYSLTSLDLSNFDINNAIDIRYMFRGCLNLKFLNLKNFKLNDKCKLDNLFKDMKPNLCDLITNDETIKKAFLN